MSKFKNASAEIEPSRFEKGAPMLVVGLAGRFSVGATQGIPAQWQRFRALRDRIADKTASMPVGISIHRDADGNFDYLCAQEVSKFSSVPPGCIALRVPGQIYAVFLHGENVSTLSATYFAVWEKWLPASGYVFTGEACIERHGETFDPVTGEGGVEIWLPVAVPKAGAL